MKRYLLLIIALWLFQSNAQVATKKIVRNPGERYLKEHYPDPLKEKKLYLSHNNLHVSNLELPQNIASFVNLEDFVFWGSGVSDSFPSGFFTLTKLKRLEVVGTKIRRIPKEMAKLKDLESLSMGGILSVSEELVNMQELRELDLNGCSLDTLPKFMLEMPALTKLMLNRNSIRYIDTTFDPTKCKLETIDLSMNCLHEFPYKLLRIPTLRILKLSYNNIGDINYTDTLTKATDIEIYLDSCGIKSLRLDLPKIPSISLVLQYNDLEYIDTLKLKNKIILPKRTFGTIYSYSYRSVLFLNRAQTQKLGFIQKAESVENPLGILHPDNYFVFFKYQMMLNDFFFQRYIDERKKFKEYKSKCKG